jgi:hypothetical protein
VFPGGRIRKGGRVASRVVPLICDVLVDHDIGPLHVGGVVERGFCRKKLAIDTLLAMAVELVVEDKDEPWFEDDWGSVSLQRWRVSPILTCQGRTQPTTSSTAMSEFCTPAMSKSTLSRGSVVQPR